MPTTIETYNDAVLGHVPMYMIELGTDEQRQKFMEWYNDDKAEHHGEFDFKSQLSDGCYCTSEKQVEIS